MNAAIAAAALALGACSPVAGTPSGQIVARVNGQDITLSELNGEILASNLPSGVDEKTATRAVLERLVSRALLAEAAREGKLHESKDYLLTRRREEQNELVMLAERQIASRIGSPSTAEIDAFIAGNPGMFKHRKIFVLDQIRLLQPKDLNDLRYLEPARTLDDVAAALGQNAVRFERVPAILDSASLASTLAARIDSLPPGEVFVMTSGGTVFASTVRERRPAAVSDDIARDYAALLLRQRQTQQALESRLAALRREASIAYQTGYAPAAPQASGPAGRETTAMNKAGAQ